MRDKPYYSVRTGKNAKGSKLDLPFLKRLFLALYDDLDDQGYLQESFGMDCVDGYQAGSLGEHIEAAMLFALRKENLWPIRRRLESYSEEDLFDVIEFIHDHVSAPVDGHYHSFSNCGMHFEKYNRLEGQEYFRRRANELLESYQDGFRLTSEGEIQAIPDAGMATLMEAPLPSSDPEHVDSRVASAIAKFRRHHSSLEDRREALRALVDVVEYLRPKVKQVLTKKDEDDLFNIANNFGVRHHNDKQKTNYNAAVWYSWMFYYYLASIHACLHLVKAGATEDQRPVGNR